MTPAIKSAFVVAALLLGAYNSYALAAAGSIVGAVTCALMTGAALVDARSSRGNAGAQERAIVWALGVQFAFFAAAEIAEGRAECRARLEASPGVQ